MVRPGTSSVIDIDTKSSHSAHVTIRLPHPSRKSPTRVTGGEYDPESERVVVASFSNRAEVILEFES